MIAVAIPQILSWILIFFARKFIHILLARFMCGLSGGALYVIIPLFTSEISDDKIRGRLGSVYVFSVAIGILFAYTCGTFFSYQVQPFIYAPISILFLIGSTFHPDSAHYFLKVARIAVSEDMKNHDGLIDQTIFQLIGSRKLFEIFPRC